VRAPADVDAWQGPYLDEEVPLDPWTHPYQYERKPSGLQDFTLYSLGADKNPGGDGLDADVGFTPDNS
jgi:general secretion pathway protein G